MKIIVYSTCGKESDIIDMFLRHTLTFADGILLLLNNSDTATEEIVRALAMDNPIDISKREGEFKQVAFNDILLQKAISYQADVLMPLDCDEFPVAMGEEKDIRRIIESVICHDKYLQYQWATAIPMQEKERYCLSDSFQVDWESKNGYKIILPAALMDRGISVIRGNHGLIGADSIDISDRLRLIHMPLRSVSQMKQKAENYYRERVAAGNVQESSDFMQVESAGKIEDGFKIMKHWVYNPENAKEFRFENT